MYKIIHAYDRHTLVLHRLSSKYMHIQTYLSTKVIKIHKEITKDNNNTESIGSTDEKSLVLL
jgi:hypothetical protein